MNYVEIFQTALTALRANLMRTALTMLGIIIGITSVILIISLAQGATAAITNQISSFGTNLIFITPGGGNRNGPPIPTNTLTYEDALEIGELPYASAVTPLISRQYQIVADGLTTNASVQGVSEGYMTVQSVTMDKGDFISLDDVNGLSRVAVLGSKVAGDLFGEGFDPVGETVIINSKPFRVVGVTVVKGGVGIGGNPDESVYIPVTTAQTILMGQNFVQNIQIDAGSPDQVEPLQNEINQLLLDRHKITDENLKDFRIETSQQFLSTLGTITNLLTAMLAGIAAISLVVGGIGIMNIMLVTVTERTKEIGLLKAIGAKRKDILVQFLIESVVLTLSGGAVGIVLGISLSFLITTFMLHVPFVFQISSVLLAVGVSTLVGVTFGVYPAQRAARLSPIDALRYE
ncbi:MAG: ABC transporter permease [Candidatus Curtissbacteria bacterium]|nr:ABC transporter permease [Candidatus Curtissbacteria bacterium]